MLARIRKSMEEKDQGFTLIELLVVMIIIGILAAIAIPVFLSQREKARDTATKADVSTVGKEIAAYYVDGTGNVRASVDAAGGTLTLKDGAVTLTTVKLSDGTNLLDQAATNSASAWCVALTNANGSATNKTWKFTNAGLASGKCL